MDKYIVIHSMDACELKYPESEGYDSYCEDRCMLYKTDGYRPVELICVDSASPEDRTLLRCYSSIVDELNKLDKKYSKLVAAVEALRADDNNWSKEEEMYEVLDELKGSK
jgi:hypothetical protein